MSEYQVLIIDAEAHIRRSLSEHLHKHGYIATTAADGEHGLTQTQTGQFHIVLVDLQTPHVTGLQFISALKAEQPDLPIIIIAGPDAESNAIAAIREGAWDYIAKPFQDMEKIVVSIERALETTRLRNERERLQLQLDELSHSFEEEVTHHTQNLQAHHRELAALNRVSYAISDLLDLDTMLHRAIDASMAAISVDGGLVRLLNPVTRQLVIAVTRGLSESYRISTQAIPLGQGIVGQVAQSGQLFLGRDLSSDSSLAPLGEIEGFRAYLCVPLRTGQRIVGTLEMATSIDRVFSSREIELVTTIGNQIGLAVARAQYAAELERANADLRRLDTLREQFIQNVAHELRTPLALAHGYVEMLTQGNLNPEEQQMALNVASRRIRALVDLVHSITTLQDLDSQPLRVETVKPNELVTTAIRMATQRAMTSRVRLKEACPEDLPAFQGDFTRLTQALHQLLDNACKFSPEGSTITVTAQMTPETVSISVEDQGIGIPLEQQQYIFDRFYQADGSSRRRYSGTGLGLAIAKEICEAHGGHLTVKSEVNKGSVFSIHLPRNTQGAPATRMPDNRADQE